MNFSQLSYILAVDQHRSFARAAEQCHITQATLSGMIKKLEQELDVILFDRTRHPIQTTEEGQQVLALARDILRLQNEMLLLNQKEGQFPQGELRLGIIPTVANALLPLILPTFLEEHPDLKLKITEITTEEIIKQLKEDKIDAGILATPLEDPQIEENILYYEAMMVYGVSSGHKKYLPTKAVQNQNIWLLEEGNCFRNQSATICNIREKDQAPENLHFAGSSFDTLLNLTDRFGGYTLVPELYYQLMAEDKRQKTRHFEKPMPVREISLVYNRPYARKQSLDLMAQNISKMVSPQLSTYALKAKDLDLIGI